MWRCVEGWQCGDEGCVQWCDHVRFLHLCDCDSLYLHVLRCVFWNCSRRYRKKCVVEWARFLLHVVQCHVLQWHVVQCHVVQCHVVQCHVVQCHVVQCHVL